MSEVLIICLQENKKSELSLEGVICTFGAKSETRNPDDFMAYKIVFSSNYWLFKEGL